MLKTPTTAKHQKTCEHPSALFAISRDAKTNRLLAGGMDGAVSALEGEGEEAKLKTLATPHANYLSSMAIVGETVVTGGFDRELVWTSLTDGKILRRQPAHDGWVRDLVAFAEGTKIASVGDDMLVRIWDAGTGKAIHTLEGHPQQSPQGYTTALYAIATTEDGKYLASGDRIGEVRVWDADAGKLLASFHAPEFYTYDPKKRVRSIGGIRSLAFSADGTQLAIAGIGQVTNVDGFVGPCRVEVWDWREKKRTFAGQDKHNAVLNHVAFHSQAETPLLIAAGGGDGGGILAFWDLNAEAPIHKAKPKGHLHRFCFGADPKDLFAAGYDGVQVWELGEDPAKPDLK